MFDHLISFYMFSKKQKKQNFSSKKQIGSFLLGFTYCDRRERESDRNIIFRYSFNGSFFLGFHIVTTGHVFFSLTMIQKRKNIKTLGNLINTRGLCPLVQIKEPCVSMLFLLLNRHYLL
jgi:hypothetical protein